VSRVLYHFPSSKHHLTALSVWISLSSSVIIFNKWILDTAKFHYPIVLTTWHLTFATIMTQGLARFTTVLDSRKKVPMTGRVYLRAIVPIGVMFSLSLICGNLTYLYLSVSFIQMLKVRWEPTYARFKPLTTTRPPLQSLSFSLPGEWASPHQTSRLLETSL